MFAIKFWQTLTRYSFCCVAFCVCAIVNLAVFSSTAFANPAINSNSKSNLVINTQQGSRWQQVQTLGRNQDVYFYAWGGDAQINAYIQWAAQQVKTKYNINLVHVKLSDTSEAVSRVLAEKSANNNNQGSVDLMWINGANFATMSEHSLLLKAMG